MLKLFLIAILPVFVIGIGLFWLLVDVNSSEEEIKENILPLKINGRVIEKQIDYKNHATKYVVVKLSNGKRTTFYDSFWYPIFENSSIGDSIFKNNGSIRMYVLKKMELKRKLIIVHPTCIFTNVTGQNTNTKIVNIGSTKLHNRIWWSRPTV